MKKTKKEKEQIELMASIVQSKIMNEVDNLLKSSNRNRSYLAEMMSTSNSFVSQLFSLDKPLNLKHIAQFERIFQKRFTVTFDEARIRKEFDLTFTKTEQNYGRGKVRYLDFNACQGEIVKMAINKKQPQEEVG